MGKIKLILGASILLLVSVGANAEVFERFVTYTLDESQVAAIQTGGIDAFELSTGFSNRFVPAQLQNVDMLNIYVDFVDQQGNKLYVILRDLGGEYLHPEGWQWFQANLALDVGTISGTYVNGWVFTESVPPRPGNSACCTRTAVSQSIIQSAGFGFNVTDSTIAVAGMRLQFNFNNPSDPVVITDGGGFDRISLTIRSEGLTLSRFPEAIIVSESSTNTEYAPGLNADLQGLEWLSLEQTAGLSRYDVEDGFTGVDGTTYAPGEWQYATREQTETLLGSLWGGVNGESQSNYAGADWFVDNFWGLGYDSFTAGVRVDGKLSNETWTEYDYTSFFFGLDGECNPDVTVGCEGRVEVGVTTGNAGIGYFFEERGVDAGLYDWNYYLPKSEVPMSNGIPTYGSLLVRVPVAIITIDIKPDSDPNSINPKSNGVIPVAVLGSTDFLATDVDVLTVTFGPDGAMPAHDGHVEDVNDDGYMDMMFHFRTQETGIVCGDTEATLTGELYDGTQVAGTDSVNTVGCKGKSSNKVSDEEAEASSSSSAGSVSWVLLLGLGVLGLFKRHSHQ